MKKVIIVGAGPGGLTAAMLLSSRGFNVEVFEEKEVIGGRNASIILKNKSDKYKFDVGPTFLMMKFILDEVFHEAKRNSNNYLDFINLDPMYHLSFDDKVFKPSPDNNKTIDQIKEVFPDDAEGFKKFLDKESRRFKLLYPCLQKDYNSFKTFFHKDFLKAVPFFSLQNSIYEELGKYFKYNNLKLSFTFQSKYLGMSPWDCPASFLIIPFIEHNYGIFHVKGGLCEISNAMAKVVKEHGGKIHLGKKVKDIIVNDNKTKGIRLENGEEIYCDELILNSDFAYSMTNLFKNNKLKKYTPKKLDKKHFSCSTFMLYLGLDKKYKEAFHNIIFAKDYKKNTDNIFHGLKLSDDFSIYIRNASLLDDSLAPKNQSAIYVLVPCPNNRSNIDWNGIKKDFRNKIISMIKERTSMKDIDNHIVVEKIITPDDWESNYNVHIGATFNLGHNISQMLYFRPHNKFEEFDNCYLVGGGTHPGSGLPTIYESGRISANLISKKYKVEFESMNRYV